ncbi:arsenate reductase/protein-tyrosine-phosphatase family protein [Bifidobacterium choloepi]|uniref:Low molecular weight phosphatase family protein n=1 Tax=Bifidobacterium choloepi TaxID=2614131 RepID=A0A6I5NCU9_9BIFI|nr:low molecular weight phosphatase family protein [Bifidobacterium choloepi]NEG70370.1 low molecular weight phosphatase family protein [Bifidobacterium choloepi]
MKVLFVCTGNICRSPMGELLFPKFFDGEDLVVDSAGTQGLIDHEIDPSSRKLLESDGIDSSKFRSKRLTPQLAKDSDLILCFTKNQQRQIASVAPTAAKRTATVSDFAAMCDYCAKEGMISGSTLDERIASVLDNASMIRPMLPPSADIKDPYRKEFEVFEQAHEELGAAIATIADSVLPKKGHHRAA